MADENRRPTQEDVAREAGVSRAVVSYVINNRSGGNVRISEETRQRVLTIVERLGYQPNVNARSLRTRKTQLIAVLVPDLTNPFYPHMIRGIQAAVEGSDYQIVVYDSDDSPARERAFVHTMLRRHVDGVVLVSFHLDARDVQRLTRAGTRAVAIGGRLRMADIDVVATRERPAAQEIVRYLITRGHRRIAHLAGPQDTPPGQVRLRGYREALAEAGISYDEALVRYGTFKAEGVADLVNSAFASCAPADRPTALFAANDLMAIEAMRALGRLGLRVPDDVAVCGFDNIPAAELVNPPLTTIGQDCQRMGYQAGELLLDRLSGRAASEPRRVSVPYRLIVRDSS
ncbi:MAG: LacI family DNA-binding transcriptional regulator [Anaerolineae bacterium]|nr:LacI family DNA-binding transcriptional regulator [Anaerolineae bacterium]